MSRYAPYIHRPKPLLAEAYNADDAEMTRHYYDLVDINITKEKLATFVHDTNRWVEIPRPQRVETHGLKDIAASGFDKIWGGLAYDPLVLRLGGQHNGGEADYFEARDHRCLFRVVVPRLRHSRKLVTWDDHLKYMAEQRNEDDDDPTSTPPAASQSGSSSGISTFSSSSFSSISPPSSQTSVSSIGSTSSTISRLAVEAVLTVNPRAGRYTSGIASPTRPTPVGGGTVLGGTLRSFYSLAVADARKTADIGIMEYMHEISAAGVSKEDPTTHPAWNMDTDPHPLLHVYDKRIYPGLHDRRHNHLLYLKEPLGQVIREMNSVLGVPYSDYAILVRASQICVCCKNHFSPDAYNDHQREGKCTNHPQLLAIDEIEAFNKDSIRLRSFRDGKRPVSRGETLDCAVAAVLLEWNSRLGVPADVWVMASSAVIHCSFCDLTRSFPAHALHLDNAGACTDPGQALVIASGSESS